MKNISIFFKKNIFFFLVIILSYSFFYLKWVGYSVVPDNSILDEKNYAFAGYTFRQNLIPTAWSNLSIYRDLSESHDRGGKNEINFSSDGNNLSINQIDPTLKNISYFKYPLAWTTELDIGKGKEHVTLVQPFLDHPIFGSILYSLKSKDIHSFSQIKPSDYRLIALIISTITGILLFISTSLIFNNKTVGLISFLIYSTAPVYVLSARFALLENVLIPLYLLSLISTILYLQKKNIFYLILVGIFAGLGFITKESGIFILIASIATLFTQKIKFKNIFFVLIPFSIISLIYYAYCFYFSPELVIKLLFSQSQRSFYGPISFINSITQLHFDNFPIEGYWLFGFISLFLVVYKKVSNHITIGLLSFLFIFLFLGSLNYPWYSLPFLPFLIMSSAYFIYTAISKVNICQSILILLLPVSSSFFWGFLIRHQASSVNLYRIFLFFLISLILFRNKKIIFRLLFIALLLIVIRFNYQSIQFLVSNWSNLPHQYLIQSYD